VDIAVNLVESYLRFNGYLTMSEFEVQARNIHGEFESVTDVDVMGIRFPGDLVAGDPHTDAEARTVAIEDPALLLEPDQIDVIIGEVKQGAVDFNSGLRTHVVLHTVLRRVEWLFAGDVGAVVDEVAARSLCVVPARGGGMVRVRLVAFGRSAITDLHTIGHRHIVMTMQRFITGLDDAFRPVQFREPAPGMLNLLLKSGFELSEPDRPEG
jgi:hypothetical protein